MDGEGVTLKDRKQVSCRWLFSSIAVDAMAKQLFSQVNPLVTARKYQKKTPHFSPILLLWTSFRLISIRVAKNEFCKKRGIFSDQSDVIKQLFCFSHMCKSQNLDFSLALCFFLCLSYLLAVLLPTLSSFFCMELWLANFLGKGQI